MTARVARLLFCMSALGEIGVGLVVLAFPKILALLMTTPLDASGLLVARMLGSAVLALGVTWWIARKEPVPRLASSYLAGFLIYNLGMAALFALVALASSEPALPWLVAIAHAAVAVGFAVAVRAATRSQSGAAS